MTEADEPLIKLIAHCYMVKTDTNADLIAEIKAGIKKEVSVGFSTANAMEGDDKAIRMTESFREDLMNGPFRAMAEATEEAVLNSMSCSVAVGDVKSLADYLPRLLKH